MTWGKAIKKPITIEFREVEPNVSFGNVESIDTLEGRMRAKLGDDFIIRGIKGELYPIKKEIFNQTYDVIQSPNGSQTDE